MAFLLIKTKYLDHSNELVSFAVVNFPDIEKWNTRQFDWLYQRMIQYYELMNGESLAENMAVKIDNEYKAFLGEGADSNLPLFLNRAFAAFGSISILKSKRKSREGSTNGLKKI